MVVLERGLLQVKMLFLVVLRRKYQIGVNRLVYLTLILAVGISFTAHVHQHTADA